MKLTKTMLRAAIVVLHNRTVEHYSTIGGMEVIIDDEVKVTFDNGIKDAHESARFLSPILTTIMALETLLSESANSDEVVMNPKLDLLIAMTVGRLTALHVFTAEEIECGKTDEKYRDVTQNFEFWKAVNWVYDRWYN
mgnify:CR=1 FL=1